MLISQYASRYPISLRILTMLPGQLLLHIIRSIPHSRKPLEPGFTCLLLREKMTNLGFSILSNREAFGHSNIPFGSLYYRISVVHAAPLRVFSCGDIGKHISQNILWLQMLALEG
jgi:hypothetical protein